MSINIDTFFDYYSEKLISYGYADVDYDCAMHDLALYSLPSELDRPNFNKALKKAFFSQPVIQELRKFIDRDRYFGEIKEWVQRTCIDVPVPSRRDLTGNVQVLYKWFLDLGKDEYVIDRPSYSERISPKSQPRSQENKRQTSLEDYWASVLSLVGQKLYTLKDRVAFDVIDVNEKSLKIRCSCKIRSNSSTLSDSIRQSNPIQIVNPIRFNSSVLN